MHFTYDSTSGDLRQGDLLQRTEELNSAIQQIHPYYRAKHDYSHFLVLTQSCDLVRRAGAANYIAMCAVRPLSLVLEREARKYRRSKVLDFANAYGIKSRDRVRMFLERLFNNNNSEYFYLHDEPSIGLTDRSCAFLRLSVPMRSAEHYDTCAQARVASLTPQFQAKLGWLVGNIYSRVGTDDWVPRHASKADWDATIDRVLDETLFWLEDEKAKKAEATFSEADIRAWSEEQLRTRVKAMSVKKKKDEVIDAVVTALRSNDFIAEADAPRVQMRLTNNPVLTALLK